MATRGAARTCIVTGAASGIGKAVAVAMQGQGVTVVGFDVEVAPGATWEHLACDVTDEDAVNATVGRVLDQHGRIDILVNAAGVHRSGTVMTTRPQHWDEVIAVNLRGPFLVSRAALPAMIDQGGGVIVHVGSVAALTGGAGSAAYIASKGGLVALTRAMAADHAAHGIRVNCVCPGMVRTPMLEATESDLEPAEATRLRAERLRRHPLGRLGEPSDIVPAVLYLAGEGAAWVTGAVLTVDGGYSVQ